jgi:hypothetical protein
LAAGGLVKVKLPLLSEWSVRSRQSEIEDKLDLTKKQALAQAGEMPADTNEEAIRSSQAPKHERAKKIGIRV